MPVPVHLGIAGAVLALFALVSSRWLLRPPDERVAPDVADGRTPATRIDLARAVAGPLLMLGAIATMGQLVESVTDTWSAIYLREELGAGAGVAGLGFVALQAVQTLGRFSGDAAVTRWGDRAVARAGATLVVVVMAAALAWPTVAGTIAGLGIAGLGIATLIPASLRAADAVPGLPPGYGITLAGTILRLALVAAPLVLGLVADATSVRVAMLTIPLAGVAVLVLAGALPARRPTS